MYVEQKAKQHVHLTDEICNKDLLPLTPSPYTKAVMLHI